VTRVIWSIGCAVVVGLGALLVFTTVKSPVSSRRDAFEERLRLALPSPTIDDGDTGTSLEQARASITRKPALWAPLIAPAGPVNQPPDMAGMLKGVAVVPGQVGSGDSLRVRVRTPGNPHGSWLGVGDAVKTMRIKAITPGQVVFAMVKNGIEYTYTLGR
jgi:hypothetical protein